MYSWRARGAPCGDGGPQTPALFTDRGTSATGPNASDYGRAPAGFTPDIERSADGVEAIGHALQAGAVLGHARVEAAAVIDDPELQLAALVGQAHCHRARVGVLGDVVQSFERAEVDGGLDLLGVATDVG